MSPPPIQSNYNPKANPSCMPIKHFCVKNCGDRLSPQPLGRLLLPGCVSQSINCAFVRPGTTPQAEGHCALRSSSISSTALDIPHSGPLPNWRRKTVGGLPTQSLCHCFLYPLRSLSCPWMRFFRPQIPWCSNINWPLSH